MRRGDQIASTIFLTLLIVGTGVGYQFHYHQQRRRYTEIITGYYREYFHREPDAIGLRHWVLWAQNKWGLEKVRREGFVEAKKRGYR